MWILIATALAIAIFDLAALIWSEDSRESSQNPDWQRLQRTGPLLPPAPVSINREDRWVTGHGR
jgi:hypothetical protein